MRYRTHADDVLEAVNRGVDEQTIRELGVLYGRLISAEADDHGEGNRVTGQEIARDLKLPSGPDDYEVFEICHLEIRYRLTGHRDREIED